METRIVPDGRIGDNGASARQRDPTCASGANRASGPRQVLVIDDRAVRDRKVRSETRSDSLNPGTAADKEAMVVGHVSRDSRVAKRQDSLQTNASSEVGKAVRQRQAVDRDRHRRRDRDDRARRAAIHDRHVCAALSDQFEIESKDEVLKVGPGCDPNRVAGRSQTDRRRNRTNGVRNAANPRRAIRCVAVNEDVRYGSDKRTEQEGC